MGDTSTLQTHDDGSTCDTVSTLCVPIIFVPGVMGSRVQIMSGRTWDPDSTTARLMWLSATDASRQKTRRALRAHGASGGPPPTPGKVMTDWGSGPGKAICSNDRCRAIGAYATGAPADDASATGQDPDAIGGYATGMQDEAIAAYYATTRNWASVAWGFYGDLLIFLEATLNKDRDDPAFPVYACGYDWRKCALESGAEVAKFIEDIVSKYSAVASDAIVITHSMGGLVSRAALVAEPGVVSKIRGIIHGLQPSLGAVTCYRRFFTGASPPADREAKAADKVLNRIMGMEPAQFGYNMSGLPGPLELLPNHMFSTYFGGNWIEGLDSSFDLSAIYGVYARPSAPGIAGIVAWGEETVGTREQKKDHTVRADFVANLAVAKSFHESLETVAHPRTYVLYSTGLRTDHSLAFLNLNGSISSPGDRPKVRWRPSESGDDLTDLWTEVTYRRTNEGDGTVPAASAQCPALSPAALPPTPEAAAKALEHSAAYADPTFNAQVLGYIWRLLCPGSP